MSLSVNRVLRRRNVRVLAVATVASLGLMVGLAHSGVGDDHMGEAAAMCLAIAASIAVAVAAAPRLGRLVASPLRPVNWSELAPSRDHGRPADGRARGHPAVLQVFRR